MTFFELYRIGIPIFVPSLKLLVRWELQRHVMSERVYWKHTPTPLNKPTTPDPNALQASAVTSAQSTSPLLTSPPHSQPPLTASTHSLHAQAHAQAHAQRVRPQPARSPPAALGASHPSPAHLPHDSRGP